MEKEKVIPREQLPHYIHEKLPGYYGLVFECECYIDSEIGDDAYVIRLWVSGEKENGIIENVIPLNEAAKSSVYNINGIIDKTIERLEDRFYRKFFGYIPNPVIKERRQELGNCLATYLITNEIYL